MRDIAALDRGDAGDGLGELFPAGAFAPGAAVAVAVLGDVDDTGTAFGELFGAAEALFRARTSVDGEVRAVLERIATEEAGHAELSFQISVESVSRLGEEEQASVWSAMVAARAALREQIERRAYDPALTSLAGIPRRTEAIAIFDALDAAVWSPMLGA